MNRTIEYFKELNKRPRESGNEENVRKWILSWAEENNLHACKDQAGNIFVYKTASKGYENKESIALQAHTDMVCVKTENSIIDFSKDPIPVIEDNGFLRAENTSLGADNGIGVAMIMSLFTDKNIKTGPLEAIFTFEEETNMNGAFCLDPSYIKSRKLINLDSENSDTIFIGCAGGIEMIASAKTTPVSIPDTWKTVYLCIKGLSGGHSGAAIHEHHLNAAIALARTVYALSGKNIAYMIQSFNSGTRMNVIPSFAESILAYNTKDEKTLMETIKNAFEEIKNEYSNETGFTATIENINSAKTALDPSTSESFIQTIFMTRNGALETDPILKVVETSSNLASVQLNNNTIKVQISVRSFSDSAKHFIMENHRILYSNAGFDCNIGNGYPGWKPNENSDFVNSCAEIYRKKLKLPVKITAIHAGLECGIINSKIKGMESISIGPDLFDVHSVKERVSIKSINRIYSFLSYLFEECK